MGHPVCPGKDSTLCLWKACGCLEGGLLGFCPLLACTRSDLPFPFLTVPSPPMKSAAHGGGLAGSCLERRGRETWEGQTLLTSPNGSSQVSGPHPTFTDSQEIRKIRVTFVTTLNHQEEPGSKGVPPSLPSALAPSLQAGSLEQYSRGAPGCGGLPRG